MKKIQSFFEKISFKHFLIIFFIVFFYEYGFPIYNFLVLKKELGITFPELFEHRQVIKHFLRLPIFTVFNIVVLYFIYHKKKWAYVVQMVNFISHIIFKIILTPLTAALMVHNFGVADEYAINYPMMILQAFILTILHVSFIYYLKNFWKRHTTIGLK